MWPFKRKPRSERLDYLFVDTNGKMADAFPIIRDATNLCRSSAEIPHSCPRCPDRGEKANA